MLKRLSKDILIYGVIGGISKSLMLILVPVFTRAFSPEEYGIVDLITSLVVFFNITGMIQMEASSGRYFYEVDEKERKHYISTAFFSIVGWTSLLLIPFAIGSSLVSELLFDTNKYAYILLVSACIIFVGNLYQYLIAIMRYVRKPLIYGVVVVLNIALTLGISILFVVHMQMSIIGVFYAQLIGFAVSLAILMWYYYKIDLLSFSWRKDIIVKFLAYSLPLWPGVIGGWATYHLNRFIMLGMLSLTEIGIFAVAMKISGVLRLLEETIKVTWSPFVYENLKNENHKTTFKKVLQYVALIVFTLVMASMLFTTEIIHLLVPETYYEAIPITILLLWAFGFHVHQQLVVIGPGITKKTIYNSIFNLSGAALNVILLFVLIPAFGLIGIPLSTIAAFIFTFTFGWIVSERLYPIGFSKIGFIIPAALSLGLGFALIYFDPILEIRALVFVILLIVLSAGFFRFKKQLVSIRSSS